MPKLASSTGVIRAFDTETTGVDFRHGAKPFFVSTCTEDGSNIYWEWDVDPMTRQPTVPEEDLLEIRALLRPAATSELSLHNSKFDVTAISTIDKQLADTWRWHVVRDTLIAGHILASNHPKDLTSMVVEYLGTDIQPYEDKMEEAVKKARAMCRRKDFIEEYGKWAIAEADRPDMPSAGEKTWKYDTWLPRAIATRLGYPKGECQVVNMRTQEYDVRIDRNSKWGNPYSHLPKSTARYKVATREESIKRYRAWVQSQKDLMAALPELEGKKLGCHCSPEDCHGDVLKELLEKINRHTWWDVTKNYANVDTLVDIKLWQVVENLLKQRNLWKHFQARMKVVPIIYRMEATGVTISKDRLDTLTSVYQKEAEEAADKCVGIADKLNFELTLPKGGVNNSLREFAFDILKLPPYYDKKSKTGKPTLNKAAMEGYEATLPPTSDQFKFVTSLGAKKSRDTAVAYMQSYKTFWRPWVPSEFQGIKLLNGQARILEEITKWFVLHPSLNLTGTDTLRLSSQNPNEQNISKQGMRCLGCAGIGCDRCDGKGVDARNLRYCFGPAPGREWWSMDAKNIELRIPAYESGEDDFIALFERPDDPPYFGSNHLLISHLLHQEKFEECVNSDGVIDGRLFKKKYASTLYQRVKNGNFALLYGAVDRSDGMGTADRTYGIPGAQSRIKARFAKMESLNQYWIGFANRNGYVETMPDKTVDPKRGYPLLCTRTDYGRIKPTVPLNYHTQGCLAGSSRVLTREGLIPIKQLVGKTVQVWTGHKWANAVGLDRGRCQRAVINLSSGLIIRCDTRHKLKNELDQWVEFSALKAGDWVALPKNPDPMEASSEINWWFIFGVIIGDGCLGGDRKSLTIVGGLKKRAMLKKIYEFFQSQGYNGKPDTGWGGVKWSVRPPSGKRREKYQVSLENKDFAKFLEEAGFSFYWRSHTKMIPASVWETNEQNQRDFLEGLLLTDGSRAFTSGSGKGLNMANPMLLRQIQILSSRLGFDAHFCGTALNFRWRAFNAKSTRKYPAEALTRQVDKINKDAYENQGQCITDKRNLDLAKKGVDISQYVAERILEKNAKEAVIYRYDRIASIQVLDRQETTYTMTVDDPLHQFVADGVIHPNTACWVIIQSMVRCQQQLDEWAEDGFYGAIILQVHDELVFDFPKAAHPLKNHKRSNLWRAKKLQALMAVGGEYLIPRVPTPVSIEYHEESWAEGASCG